MFLDPDVSTKSSLIRDRHWTEWAIVEFLGDPDRLEPNPYHRNAAPMQLYAMERVRAAEASEAFQRWQQEREARRRAGRPPSRTLPAGDGATPEGTTRPVGRPRKYATAADRQAAYRERKRTQKQVATERERFILQEAEALRRTIRNLAPYRRKDFPVLVGLASLDTPDLLREIARQYELMSRAQERLTPARTGKRKGSDRRAAPDPERRNGAPGFTDDLRKRYRLEPPRQ